VSSNSISRMFGIYRYSFLVIVTTLAILYTNSIGLYFHMPIFSVFILTLIAAAWCAIRYHAIYERILIKALMFYCLAALIMNIYLFQRSSYVYIIAFLIIEADAMLFFIHRWVRLKWIIKQSKIFGIESGGDF